MGVSACKSCESCKTAPHKKVVININPEDLNKNWSDSVINNNIEQIRRLLQNDPSVINEHIDRHGNTAVHYAIRSKNEAVLLYLLKQGANINAQGGKNYNSSLHEAILLNDFKAITYLYEYGINDELKNNKNKTAMDMCQTDTKREYIKAKNIGNRKLAATKLSKECNVTIQDAQNVIMKYDTNTDGILQPEDYEYLKNTIINENSGKVVSESVTSGTSTKLNYKSLADACNIPISNAQSIIAQSNGNGDDILEQDEFDKLKEQILKQQIDKLNELTMDTNCSQEFMNALSYTKSDDFEVEKIKPNIILMQPNNGTISLETMEEKDKHGNITPYDPQITITASNSSNISAFGKAVSVLQNNDTAKNTVIAS